MAAPHIVDIPYRPREAFEALHERRQRWAIVVAHRRAGKTVACVNELIRAAFICPLPRPCFAYIAPQLNQAKDIAWNYLIEFTDCFEKAGLRKVNQSELWVEIGPRRGRIRVYGADNPDRLRGLYLDGAVLDEFGDMEPQTWSKVIRPALSDREGWAIFIGTPKGRNGFHRLWTAAEGAGQAPAVAGGPLPHASHALERDRVPRTRSWTAGGSPKLQHPPSRPSPGQAGEDLEAAAVASDWLRLMLKASETRLLGQEELADARRAMSDDEYAQEYECSFDAAVRGAYWGQEMAKLEEERRISKVAYDPALQVHTAWDLGIADSTVIWFLQEHGACGEIRVIDVLKGEGVGLDWYAKRLQERDWVWGNHYLPHDAQVRELGTGRSRVEILADLGIRATICRQLPVEDGIQAVRMLLPRCWFDKEKCAAGVEALRMYRRDYDERRQEYRVRPLHDWTSHYADAFRYFAVEHRPPVPERWRRLKQRDLRWVV